VLVAPVAQRAQRVLVALAARRAHLVTLPRPGWPRVTWQSFPVLVVLVAWAARQRMPVVLVQRARQSQLQILQLELPAT
jgi:hypothetical protein